MTAGTTGAEPTRVLVTGAASGLGAALVRAFAAAGDQVLATDVSAFEDPVEVPATATLRLDVTSDDDWAAARAWVEEHWGGLDVLVNNAGIAGGGRVEVCTMAEWQRITDINLFGVVRGVRTFTPVFKRQGGGQIVNVASLAGLVHPAGMASYNAVKAGVVAFTETIGHELAPFGVRATAVCPSFFRTNLMASMQGADAALADVIRGFVEKSPITADDIAAAVMTGLDLGQELIVPDEPAQEAYALKHVDRAQYDAVMRAGAASLAQAPLPEGLS